jgi:hypothetical protein
MTIDWVGEALRDWGFQRRRIDLGGNAYEIEGVRKWHWDGWPPRSIQGKSKDEGEGASHTADGQHYPEVLQGDGLKAARAMVGAPEVLRSIAYVHYVIPKHVASVKEKIAELRYPYPRAYYSDLGRLHIWVAARWDVPRETIREHNVVTEYL